MAFQSFAFQTAVKLTVHKCLAEPYVINGVATRTIDLPAFTVLVAKLVKSEDD